MEQDQLVRILADIHKALVNIQNSLEALAKVARAQHPEAFKLATAPQPRDRS